MASKTRAPEEVRIDLPTDEDWIVVKRSLTWGESRDAEVRLYAVQGGRMTLNPSQIGATLVAAYLLDWSIQDSEGRTIPVRRQPAEVIEAALRSLDRDKGNEVIEAITKHDNEVLLELEAQKKTRDTALTH